MFNCAIAACNEFDAFVLSFYTGGPESKVAGFFFGENIFNLYAMNFTRKIIHISIRF